MQEVYFVKIGRFAYQLMEDVSVKTPICGYNIDTNLYSLDPDGTLTGKKYYAWDGPSGAINTKDFIVGSLFHDILCDAVNEGLVSMSHQCLADDLMLNINRDQKMHWFRRAYTYLVVRGFQVSKKKRTIRKYYSIKLKGELWEINK